MRTEDRGTKGRLSPEDIAAIRARFIDSEGRMPDVRAHGAVTVSDLAEAFGVAPEDVQRVLDRYREERALVGTPAQGMDQKGLFALAVILFGAAFGIYRYGPRKLSLEEQEAQMNARMEEILERRKKNPIIHYPIITKVKTVSLPPFGFGVMFKGRLTETSAAAMNSRPVSKEAAIAALTEALANTYEVARKAEADAPEPKKPLPTKPWSGSWGFDEVPGTFRLFIGNPNGQSVAYVNVDPTLANTSPNGVPQYGGPTGVPPSRELFEGLAKGQIEGFARAQEETLKPQPVTAQYPSLPAGYQITFQGKTKTGLSGSSLNVLPFDSKRVASRLETALRSLILQDNKAPLGRYVSVANQAPTKNPIPAFLEATITGPLGEVKLKIPQTALAGYPTAADAVRAGDRILREGAQEAAKQVETLNREAGVKA